MVLCGNNYFSENSRVNTHTHTHTHTKKKKKKKKKRYIEGRNIHAINFFSSKVFSGGEGFFFHEESFKRLSSGIFAPFLTLASFCVGESTGVNLSLN